MKKIISMVIALSLICAVLQGCGSKNEMSDSSLPKEASSTAPVESPAWEDTSTDHAESEIEDTPAESTGDPFNQTDVRSKQQGHYVFQPKVCSVYMEEVFGKAMCEAWYNFVDAVMAGEDTFACPDQHTYDWMMGQFRERCFPVLTELTDYAWDRENSVIDGMASFTYLVPKEEAAARIAAFAEQIEGILNEALEDDYTDLEKALALYDYFTWHYEYDYDLNERQMRESVIDEVTTVRFFDTGMGICQQISTAYSYLLMQAGVEATVMSGPRGYDGIGHQWSYVRIGGKDYHIDPTYAIGDKGSLSYFMMTDEQRFLEDSYDPADFCITSHYTKENPHPDYAAQDTTFSELWPGQLTELRVNENKILYWKYDDSGEIVHTEFDYTGF